MQTMTASQPEAAKQRPILLRLPFSPESMGQQAAPQPPPERGFAFKPGAWEQLMVTAELDRESRELSPAS